jgi:hypothetical protein
VGFFLPTVVTYNQSGSSFPLLLITLILLLDEEDDDNSSLQQQRRDKRIPRCALLLPFEAPWEKLFNSGNDQALITATGFDYSAFSLLLNLFIPYYEQYSPYTTNGAKYRPLLGGNVGGRPRMLTATAVLGLVLMWTRTRGSMSFLSLVFGLTSSPVAK